MIKDVLSEVEYEDDLEVVIQKDVICGIKSKLSVLKQKKWFICHTVLSNKKFRKNKSKQKSSM